MLEAGFTAGMWMAAGVLGWAGALKLTRPLGTRAALRAAGLPSSPTAARLLGLVEMLIGVAALLVGGGAAALALAMAYTAFTVFSQRQRQRLHTSCGCFGDTDAPLTRIHVVTNTVAAVVTMGAAATAAPGVLTATAGRPVLVLPAIVLTATATGLVTVLLTTVPTLTTRMAIARAGGQ